MQKSDSIKELAGALVKAQAKIKKAIKDSLNPAFVRSGVVSKYADLESVVEACQEPLNENGLAVIQGFDVSIDTEKSVSYLETMLVHVSGEWVSGRQLLIPVKDDPQGLASASTYARRYGLAAMVGVVQTDDDGNAASGKSVSGGKEATHNDPQPRQEAKIEPSKIAEASKPTSRPTSGATGKHAEIVVSPSGDMATIIGWLDNAAPRKDKKQRDYLMLTIDDVSVSCFDNKLWASVQAYKGQDVKAFVDIAKVGTKTYYNLISVVPLNSVSGIPLGEKADTSGPWDGDDEKVPF